MGRKKVKNINGLVIEKIASEGKCLGRHDGKVVFVPYTAPGDVVDVYLTKSRKAYAEGHVTEFHQKSEMRIEPFCSHFSVCGGCKWQHLPYETQLTFKQQHVLEALNHIGRLGLTEILPIVSSEDTQFYRNKLEFTFTNKKWITTEAFDPEAAFEPGLGFHVPGRFDGVLDIDKCYLQSEFSNDIRDFIKNYAIQKGYTFYNVHEHAGLMRNLVIRNTSDGKQMVIVQFGEDIPDQVQDVMSAVHAEFAGIHSLLYLINLKSNETYFDQDIITYSGEDHLIEPFKRWDGTTIEFKISPKSFFQTNSKQAEKLYLETFKLAKLTGKEVVYDLYTGTGTIANYVANKALKVVGVEYVEDAILDAKVNADLNGITNTTFYAGDMKDVLNADFIARNGQPDVIITDPPRAGMHTDVIDVILGAKAQRIVYVSCNPATQARDLQLLVAGGYQIDQVQPVDMFPQTHHVENIVSLVLGE